MKSKKTPISLDVNDDVLVIIERVIENQIGHYKVYGYDRDDLKQEAFIICAEGLKKWDTERPLENFLSVHLSFRLKSLVRDLYKTQGRFAESTKLMMTAISMDSVNWDGERSIISKDDVSSEVELADLIKAIDQYLPIALRRDYLKMQAGVKINRGRAKKLREYILSLLSELSDNGQDSETE